MSLCASCLTQWASKVAGPEFSYALVSHMANAKRNGHSTVGVAFFPPIKVKPPAKAKKKKRGKKSTIKKGR